MILEEWQSAILPVIWQLHGHSLNGESREVFRKTLNLDEDTWARGRGWTLWKALIVAAGLCETNNIEGENCWRIIDEVIADYKQKA